MKWLQGLDLSLPVRNTRRDFSNGYLVAEIFSWYYPQEIQMHSFDNGTSIETKTGNWSIIKRFFQRQEFLIPKEEIEGTIHCKPGAALLLVQRIYAILTNRKVATLPADGATDFSDLNYQRSLPFHARSTATQAIKNNIANSEYVTDPDKILRGEKAQEIIRNHFRNRHLERKEDPERFGIKPSICEKSPRKAASLNGDEFLSNSKINTAETFLPQNGAEHVVEEEEEDSTMEISVKQHAYNTTSVQRVF